MHTSLIQKCPLNAFTQKNISFSYDKSKNTTPKWVLLDKNKGRRPNLFMDSFGVQYGVALGIQAPFTRKLQYISGAF